MPHRAFMQLPLLKMTAFPLSDKENERRYSRKNVIVAFFMVAIGAVFLFSGEFENTAPQVIDPMALENAPIIVDTDVKVLSEPKDWIELVVKPLIVEVGGLMLFQTIGMPIVSEVLWIARRMRWTPLIHGARRLRMLPFARKLHVVMRTSKSSRFVRALPETVRNIPRSVLKLYRRRSRWSIVSEYTNFIGNEDEDQ